MDHRNRKLADLVERYYALLYRYAYRLTGCEADAEDLTQQAFLTAQARWDQLRDETKAKSWLFTIARNAYLKELRGPVCIPSSALDELPDKSHGKSHGRSYGGNSETGPFDFDQEQLQNALHDLPEEFRSPVVLFYFEEFSYKEIAEQMDVPVGTIMSRLARAKAYLRQRLAPSEPTHSVAPAGLTSSSTSTPVSTSISSKSKNWAIPKVRAE
jgi:RNA polymerase sigma-70 factor (ECF subfamily)